MFENRLQAGMALVQNLRSYQDRDSAVVVAIPRGGVVIGRVVADELHLPLEIIVVKKLQAPENPELAIGAVGPNNTKVLDMSLALRIGVEQAYLDEEIARKRQEVSERLKKFKGKSSTLSKELYKNKIVILTDDGIATGATVEAAILAIKKQKPQKIILAIPVAPRDTIQKLTKMVDEVVVLEMPEQFASVGQQYHDFPQISDEEVRELLSHQSSDNSHQK